MYFLLYITTPIISPLPLSFFPLISIQHHFPNSTHTTSPIQHTGIPFNKPPHTILSRVIYPHNPTHSHSVHINTSIPYYQPAINTNQPAIKNNQSFCQINSHPSLQQTTTATTTATTTRTHHTTYLQHTHTTTNHHTHTTTNHHTKTISTSPITKPANQPNNPIPYHTNNQLSIHLHPSILNISWINTNPFHLYNIIPLYSKIKQN